MRKFKIYIFENGMQISCAGMSASELARAERENGKLIKVVNSII